MSVHDFSCEAVTSSSDDIHSCTAPRTHSCEDRWGNRDRMQIDVHAERPETAHQIGGDGNGDGDGSDDGGVFVVMVIVTVVVVVMAMLIVIVMEIVIVVLAKKMAATMMVVTVLMMTRVCNREDRCIAIILRETLPSYPPPAHTTPPPPPHTTPPSPLHLHLNQGWSGHPRYCVQGGSTNSKYTLTVSQPDGGG